MAERDFFVNIDLNQSELLRSVIHKSASDLSTPVDGQIYFNTASHRLRVYDASVFAFVEMSAGGSTSFSSISSGSNTTATMTVDTGASITYANSGVINSNQFKGNATVVVADGGTGVATFNAYGVISGGTTATGALQSVAPSATSGVILRGAGTSALPAWSTSTFADTYAQYSILYAGTANTVTGLAKDNSAVLVTSSAGAPSWAVLGAGQILIGRTSDSPIGATLTEGTGVTISSVSGSITISADFGVIDHGGLTGLTDDDHAVYIYVYPADNTRNVIAPLTADITALTLKASSGTFSSAYDVFAVQTHTGVNVFRVNKTAAATYVLNINTNASAAGTLGYIKMDASTGKTTGYIDTSANANGHGGYIKTAAGTDTAANGGNINTSAGDFSGGSIDLSGGAAAVGGSITMSNGGGSILTNSTTASYVRLGTTANRIIITTSSPGSSFTATLPNVTGTFCVAATSVTATQALFATTTAGSPSFRAIASGDLPTHTHTADDLPISPHLLLMGG